MGVKVKVTTKPIGDLGPAVAQAMHKGGEVILGMSDALAPKEPSPRHDEHGVDTGIVSVEPTRNGYRMTVGYGAFWMRIQASHPEWHHPNGGQWDFLLAASVEGEDQLWAQVAEATRGALAS